jgi:hypothetical protein
MHVCDADQTLDGMMLVSQDTRWTVSALRFACFWMRMDLRSTSYMYGWMHRLIILRPREKRGSHLRWTGDYARRNVFACHYQAPRHHRPVMTLTLVQSVCVSDKGVRGVFRVTELVTIANMKPGEQRTVWCRLYLLMPMTRAPST